MLDTCVACDTCVTLILMLLVIFVVDCSTARACSRLSMATDAFDYCRVGSDDNARDATIVYALLICIPISMVIL